MFKAAIAVALACVWIECAYADEAAPAPDLNSPSIAAQTGAPLPPNVTALDAALDTRDYATINQSHASAKSIDELMLLMNWEQERSFGGKGGVYLSLIYMTDLWDVASLLATSPAQARNADQMKQSAVFIGLYSYALIDIDGARCADPTAPAHRLDQLFHGRPGIWTFAPTIPKEQATKMLKYVALLEAGTASSRKSDDVLCMGGSNSTGMTGIMYGLLASAQSRKPMKEDAPKPGQIGHTYTLPPPPDDVLFLKPEVWKGGQDKLRADLPAHLATLIETGKL
jgi:hypothetical protein